MDLVAFDFDSTRFLGVLWTSYLISILIQICYLATLQNAMEKVPEANREMPPKRVWLELIPLVNFVWQFFNVKNVTLSLEREFHSRGNNIDIRGTANIGKAHCILYCCSYIPFLSDLAALGSFVCWIIFWVRISNLKNQL